MDKLPDRDAACILAEALLGHLVERAGARADGCDAIGQVLNGSVDDKRISYVFKHGLHTGAWSLVEVTPDKYPADTILYYHDTIEDAVTQAALHGDELEPEDSEL
jgi:hypothetical protein